MEIVPGPASLSGGSGSAEPQEYVNSWQILAVLCKPMAFWGRFLQPNDICWLVLAFEPLFCMLLGSRVMAFQS